MNAPSGDAWLACHPYLQPVADLHALVECAASDVSMPTAPVPAWSDYAADFHAGVPLLRSARTAIDLRAIDRALCALVERLASSPLPDTLAADYRGLRAALGRDEEAPRRAVASLLEAASLTSTHDGLLRYLGWTVAARYLGPVVATFRGWRDEERWLRHYCPTCGTPPAMGQLVGADPGRLRLLSCGCCRTRWRYRRTGCPFCETEDDHRLAAFAVEGEGALRIDYCETCRGYLKTYVGEGRESVFLADWTSLHLDVIARSRGLNRRAASLYEL